MKLWLLVSTVVAVTSSCSSDQSDCGAGLGDGAAPRCTPADGLNPANTDGATAGAGGATGGTGGATAGTGGATAGTGGARPVFSDGGPPSLDGGAPALADASASPPDAAIAPFGSITSGNYKVTAAVVGADGCKLDPGVLATMMTALPVEVSGGLMKVGNPKGEPPIPSLGAGPYVPTGGTFKLRRTNHVQVGSPSTCEYDADVTSTITLDAIDSFGIGVVEKQTNRQNCPEPAGIGATCTSTWAWRMVKM